MSATVTSAGLVYFAKLALGIIPTPEALLVALYNDNSTPGPDEPFLSYVFTGLPGGAPQLLAPSSWVDMSGSELGNFVYPLLTWTFSPTTSGDTLMGYLVYSGTTFTPLWYEDFTTPQIVAPTGGASFLNIELQDLNAP